MTLRRADAPACQGQGIAKAERLTALSGHSTQTAAPIQRRPSLDHLPAMRRGRALSVAGWCAAYYCGDRYDRAALQQIQADYATATLPLAHLDQALDDLAAAGIVSVRPRPSAPLELVVDIEPTPLIALLVSVGELDERDTLT